jgi:hypothetical protein
LQLCWQQLLVEVLIVALPIIGLLAEGEAVQWPEEGAVQSMRVMDIVQDQANAGEWYFVVGLVAELGYFEG